MMQPPYVIHIYYYNYLVYVDDAVPSGLLFFLKEKKPVVMVSPNIVEFPFSLSSSRRLLFSNTKIKPTGGGLMAVYVGETRSEPVHKTNKRTTFWENAAETRRQQSHPQFVAIKIPNYYEKRQRRRRRCTQCNEARPLGAPERRRITEVYI